MSVQHETKSIPLNRLVLWEGNVRKTAADTGLDELAASIEAHGLLNPLTVGGQFRKKHHVIAGGRRLRALNALAQAGRLPKDWAVPCVVAADADHAELSLAENVVRVAMHPADQFEAWRTLAEQGHEPDRITAGTRARIERPRRMRGQGGDLTSFRPGAPPISQRPPKGAPRRRKGQLRNGGGGLRMGLGSTPSSIPTCLGGAMTASSDRYGTIS
ncbi:ParB/Srx family N-terminal domain-containing protein [Methylobacterium variabile]|uniref:ParB/Srx family N-terminal domain-containing protein n=1 Tax=Methylobacterium variabile TaxID=298794 RepID=UPI00069E2EA1|nr:ParB/Srx family N-terminal domain-containing protein [Methylobacterium variabile]